MNKGLRRVVDRERRVRHDTRDRADIHDDASRCFHFRQDGATHVERAAGIDPHDEIPIFVCGLGHSLFNLYTRVVDENRDLAEVCSGFGDNARHIGRSGHVRLNPECSGIQVGRSTPAAACEHVDVIAQKAIDNRASDSAAPACNDRCSLCHGWILTLA